MAAQIIRALANPENNSSSVFHEIGKQVSELVGMGYGAGTKTVDKLNAIIDPSTYQKDSQKTS